MRSTFSYEAQWTQVLLSVLIPLCALTTRTTVGPVGLSLKAPKSAPKLRLQAAVVYAASPRDEKLASLSSLVSFLGLKVCGGFAVERYVCVGEKFRLRIALLGVIDSSSMLLFGGL